MWRFGGLVLSSSTLDSWKVRRTWKLKVGNMTLGNVEIGNLKIAKLEIRKMEVWKLGT